ncbi:hypothetical protein OG897_34245 [Streptomyces sp. NBC_00237]|uniref:hypothetical protein n=1 Tax=Streptomyces sp. NBC_00237 TaxID=2975687 RepID=UPI00224C9F28|nr:hypothetical protein [Streptomyces sp. NBC_00237]MCX5206456.1 hypothetical protein [Streptomyces sp. NBC_00237]
MKEQEMLSRVIGVLTQSGQWYRDIHRDPHGHEPADGRVVGELVAELLDGALPTGLSEEEERELRRSTARLVSVFAFVFHQLAEVHDTGRGDTSSSELLQQLALKAGYGKGED